MGFFIRGGTRCSDVGDKVGGAEERHFKEQTRWAWRVTFMIPRFGLTFLASFLSGTLVICFSVRSCTASRTSMSI